jgi:hypothetical protein
MLQAVVIELQKVIIELQEVVIELQGVTLVLQAFLAMCREMDCRGYRRLYSYE